MEACQTYCKEFSLCNYVTFHTGSGMCHIKKNVQGRECKLEMVSAPRDCRRGDLSGK